MRAATPKPPLQPGSALDQGLSWSVPSTCPLSSVAMPLDAAVINTSVLSGKLALPRQMTQPRQPESLTASSDLLLTQSSQILGSQPEVADSFTKWWESAQTT